MPLWFRIVRLWLPVAVAVTVAIAFAYAGLQQGYRSGLNDPQIQMARDVAAALVSGRPAADVVPTGTVDIATSLAPFAAVYAPDNSAVAGSGELDGSLPKPPAGMLDSARSAGETRVTWQPRRGVRIATVNVATKDGQVVMAGRNMSEVENRIGALGLMALAAWVVALVGAFVAAWLVEAFGTRLRAAREA